MIDTAKTEPTESIVEHRALSIRWVHDPCTCDDGTCRHCVWLAKQDEAEMLDASTFQ